MATLLTYPRGSLGRVVAETMSARGLMLLRGYETHDALHALLEYDTTVRGELEVQAFMWANGSATVAGRALFARAGSHFRKSGPRCATRSHADAALAGWPTLRWWNISPTISA